MERMGGLIKALSAAVNRQGYKDKRSHGVGYKYSHPEINKRFTYDNLWVEIIQVPSKKDSLDLETEMLDEYEYKYGEAPPFNEGRTKKR